MNSEKIAELAIRGVLMGAAVTPSIGTPKVALADGCQFEFGAKNLHDADPGDVGDCLANMVYLSNGDGMQPTTKGEVVWRKNSNSTAFTNGGQTFLLDPVTGKVLFRDAMSRFTFEPDYPASVVPIDPQFPADKAFRIRKALYSFPYDPIDGSLIDPQFEAASVGKLPPGLLDKLKGYMSQRRPVDYLRVVDNITPDYFTGCPPISSLSCAIVKDTLSKTGSIGLYPAEFLSSDGDLTLTLLKEAMDVDLLLYMLNTLKIDDVNLLETLPEQYTLDMMLNIAPRFMSLDSRAYKTLIQFNAPNTWGQEYRLTSLK